MNAFTKMRKKRGYSQESVAAAIGVERSTIAKWETGIAKPRIDNLLALSELYKCGVNELLATSQEDDTDLTSEEAM